MKKTKKAIAAIAMIAAVSAAGCAGHADKEKEALTVSIDSLFTPLFHDDEPGAVVLVAKGDSILYDRGFGIADFRNNRQINDSTLLNICSISKQFTAVALLKLQEEGKLSLDDSVSKFFPKFRAPFFRRITIRHLLSHTSGLPDTRPRTRKQWEEYARHNRTAFANVHDYCLYSLTSESTRYFETLDSLAFEPGTAYEYQNPTYQLALPIIERVTGCEFKAWMDSAIFKPAGMEHTEYLEPALDQEYFAHAYRPATGANVNKYYRTPDGRWEEYDYGEANFFPTKADGALFTSAKEFLKWKKALFGGKIIGDSALAQAITPVIGTDLPRTDYGLGFFIENYKKDTRKIFHTGDNGGFLTVAAYYPEKDIFYLIFANRPDWNREATMEALEKVLSTNALI